MQQKLIYTELMLVLWKEESETFVLSTYLNLQMLSVLKPKIYLTKIRTLKRIMIEEKEVLNIAILNIRRVLEFSPYKSYSGINNREEFQNLLLNDPAFGALGLNDERYVIARVGGNLVTSLHRKIGDLYEGIFAYLLKETYSVSDTELHFGVEVRIGDRVQIRSTDGLITRGKYNELIPEQWLQFDGIGFEVRSCYQIGDSKRIQADYDMSLALKANRINPVMLIM